MTLGRLFNGDAPPAPLDAALDTSDHDTDSASIAYTAQPYTVASSGRGTLSISGPGVNRNFVFYLDGIADGYVIELGTDSGNAGLLEAQYTPPGGVFPDTLLGFFVAGTQFAQTPGRSSGALACTLSFGLLSGTYSSGQFDVDTTTGRGFGTHHSRPQSRCNPRALPGVAHQDRHHDLWHHSGDGTITWLIAN